MCSYVHKKKIIQNWRLELNRKSNFFFVCLFVMTFTRFVSHLFLPVELHGVTFLQNGKCFKSWTPFVTFPKKKCISNGALSRKVAKLYSNTVQWYGGRPIDRYTRRDFLNLEERSILWRWHILSRWRWETKLSLLLVVVVVVVVMASTMYDHLLVYTKQIIWRLI